MLSYKAYSSIILVLAIVGLLASSYLAISHYRNYTDIDYSSFCAISRAINCDTVSQSPWSILWDIPLALWGISAYLFVIVLSLPALRNKEKYLCLWDLLFIIALFFSIADIYFGYVSAKKIHAYCIVCLFTYAISFSLLFFTWMIRRRFNRNPLLTGLKKSLLTIWNHKPLFTALFSICIIFISLHFLLPKYWIFTYPMPSPNVTTGTTDAGNPWIGAKEPILIIEEFTDYQCFQCSKMHLMLRILVNQYPEKIRLVHHHYPLDSEFNNVLVKKPFHEGSGMLAMLAIATEKQGKFWQANDGLYSIAHQNIKEFTIQKFAQKLGIDSKKLKQDMYSENTLKILEKDIRKGLKNKIIGTPSFIVEGKMYAGHLPAEIFKKINKE